MAPTYYKDPKDMTPDQLQKFKWRARVYKMTPQDYMNWLLLYQDDPDALAPQHLENLHRVMNGELLKNADVPREHSLPPLTAREYFEKIAQIDQQLIPQEPNTGDSQIPANYMEYSQFERPQNLKHLDDYDHDEKLTKYQHRSALDVTLPMIEHNFKN